MLNIELLQQQLCKKFGAPFEPCSSGSKLGISQNVREGVQPVNGLRHPATGDTCGWYIWAGDQLSEADDFFVPLHLVHLQEWCPQVQKFLALPAGWRFLIADNYEDVWFDPNLLLQV